MFTTLALGHNMEYPALGLEAHCQRGSSVPVELGQPLRVNHEDTESHAGRERMRSLTREVEERLLPLTNWMP